MTVNELKKYTTSNVFISATDTYLIIESRTCKYADTFRLDRIEAIELAKDKVDISIPNGSAKRAKDISIDFVSGAATSDGKVYDEPWKTEEKSIHKKQKFTPTINGFSVKSVKTMPAEDGYALSCDVYFGGKKIGHFLDKGDGGMYYFNAVAPYSTQKIESVIRTFPPVERDYGLGLMEVEYDMCQMVNELVEMGEIAKKVKNYELYGRDYVVIDCWKEGRHLTTHIRKDLSEAELNEELRGQMESMGLNEYEYRRYRNLDELTKVNTFVSEEMIIG